MTNSDSYQTPNQTAAEVVNQLKAACPNSASAIQVLADKITAEKDRYAQQYMNFINTMPQSIKDADAKVRFIFLNILGQNTLYSFLPKTDKNMFDNFQISNNLCVPPPENFMNPYSQI